MKLSDKFYLCYVNAGALFAWIREKNLTENSFQIEKQKWKKIIAKEPNFFSGAELLMLDEDVVLLKTVDDNHTFFLARTYKLEYQEICQKIFQDRKNIIIISDRQWKEQKGEEKLVVLFKDQEIIKRNLSSYF